MTEQRTVVILCVYVSSHQVDQKRNQLGTRLLKHMNSKKELLLAALGIPLDLNDEVWSTIWDVFRSDTIQGMHPVCF